MGIRRLAAGERAWLCPDGHTPYAVVTVLRDQARPEYAPGTIYAVQHENGVVVYCGRHLLRPVAPDGRPAEEDHGPQNYRA